MGWYLKLDAKGIINFSSSEEFLFPIMDMTESRLTAKVQNKDFQIYVQVLLGEFQKCHFYLNFESSYSAEKVYAVVSREGRKARFFKNPSHLNFLLTFSIERKAGGLRRKDSKRLLC